MDLTAESEVNSNSLPRNDCSATEIDSRIDAGTSNIPSNGRNEKNDEECSNLQYFSVSSIDSYTPLSSQENRVTIPIELSNWEPCLIGDKLVIKGYISGLVETYRVFKRSISTLIFIDEKNLTCCILGPMKEENDVPAFVRNQFKYLYQAGGTNADLVYKDGIPGSWSEICRVWKLYNENKNETFDWETLLPEKNTCERSISKSRKKINTLSEIKRKYEKYKNLLYKEMKNGSNVPTTNDDDEISNLLPKNNLKSNVNASNKESNQTSNLEKSKKTTLNKRTNCYINNHITDTAATNHLKTVSSQTDLSINDWDKNNSEILIDKNKSSNVTIVSPKRKIKLNTILENNLNKISKNKTNTQIIATKSKSILQDLTNNKKFLKSVEVPLVVDHAFNKRYLNLKPKRSLNIKKDFQNYSIYHDKLSSNNSNSGSSNNSISSRGRLRFPTTCFWKPLSLTLDTFSNDLTQNNISLEFNSNVVANSTVFETPDSDNICTNTSENDKEIDIDIFSRSIINSLNNTNIPIGSDVKKKHAKTIKNNIDKKTHFLIKNKHNMINSISNKKISLNGMKQKRQTRSTGNEGKTIETNPEIVKKCLNLNLSRRSPRINKYLNYRELLSSYISLPYVEKNNITPEIKRSPIKKSESALLRIMKKCKRQLKYDTKFFEKCVVVLTRENFELNSISKINKSNFGVMENDNCVTSKLSSKQTVKSTDHVFKTPISTTVKKSKITNVLNKSLPENNQKNKKPRKKLSLPANAIDIFKIVQPKRKMEKEIPPSPFPNTLDTIFETCDKNKRRKLFSPDNWIQSDGCLQNLSRHQNHHDDGRFSLRLDADHSMDSELSDFAARHS